MNQDDTIGLASRRALLKALGAGAAGLALPRLSQAVAGPAATAPAGRAAADFKLGMFTYVYANMTLEETARRIREDGFPDIISDYRFADVQFDPHKPDWEVLKKITTTLEKHQLRTVGLFGYFNVVDPDVDRRRRGEARMQMFFENWKRFGSPIVCTETGTFNADSQWMEAPENYTEEGYQQCKAAFAKLVRAAEKTGAIVAIEPYWRNVIDSAERAERLLNEIASPSFKLIMDPCNYFRNEDCERVRPMLDDIFKRVGKHTILAHAKDVKPAEKGSETPAPGKGVLDYPYYLKLLAGLGKDLPLLIEHLTLDDVPRARDFVREQMRKASNQEGTARTAPATK